MTPMLRTVLICHEDSVLHTEGLAGWLASFSHLAGIVILKEPASRARQRIRREFKRVGALGMADVVAFRAYYKLFLAATDHRWVLERQREMRARYPMPKTAIPTLHATSPNTADVEKFVRDCQPDMMFALCKTIIKKSVFSVPRLGTYVFHPGVCPEYRNAHGCFWALVKRDMQRVGMTLLRIDEGVDTGPVYGFFSYKFDELKESHYVIQNRVVLENLDSLRDKLLEIQTGSTASIDTHGRASGVWGQPRLSAWLKWKRLARAEAAKQ